VNNSFDFKICIKRQLINNSKRNYCIAIKRQEKDSKLNYIVLSMAVNI